MNEPVFLRAALKNAGRSWHVFPLWPRKKVPLGGDDAKNGVLDATTDEATIRAWWAREPNANIGLATGLSKLAVIDCDGEHGLQALAAWEQEHGVLLDTVTAITPSGGRHLLFAYDGDELAPGTDVFGKGSKVDLRVGNSYIVVAPSVHPNGGTYRWAEGQSPNTIACAPLPDELLETLRDRHRPTITTTHADDAGELIASGEQDGFGAARAAQLARKGLTRDEARAVLGSLIDSRFEGGWSGADPSRPWTWDDVDRWLKCYDKGFYDPLGGQTDEERVAELLPGAKPVAQTAAAAPKTKAKRATASGFTAAELEDEEFAPLNWVIHDVMPEGASLLAGKPKAGKSWLALGLGYAVASTDEYAFGELVVERGDVLYLALEDSKRRLKRRLSKMLKTGRPWSDRLHFFTEWPRTDEGGIEAIEAWLDEHEDAQLVVIDTLKHFESADMATARGGYRSDYASIAPLQQLAQRRGVAVVIITHLRKLASDDPIDMVQSTLGTTAGIDNFYIFTRAGKGSPKGTLYYQGRDVDQGELALIWKEGDSMLWRIDDTPAPPSPKDETLALFESGAELTAKEVAEKTGALYDTALKRVQRLVEAGQLERTGRGQYRLASASLLAGIQDWTGQ